MHAFQYHRPGSSKDAVSLIGKKSEGRYLAGGQSLIPAMRFRLAVPDIFGKRVQKREPPPRPPVGRPGVPTGSTGEPTTLAASE